MLVESAFSMLPEFVAGCGFQRVRREANATGSFSFALLNALHSKNVLDPIRRIQMEMRYATGNVPLPAGGDNRHCDIFLDYGGSKIGTSALANYGWRYRNYVEAKFLKSYRQTRSGQDTRSSQNSAEIVADLLRLVTLVPEPQVIEARPNPVTASARYFLCLADRAPSIFVNQYLEQLWSAFDRPQKKAEIALDLTTGKASKAFSERVGHDFNRLNLQIASATCFAHYPFTPGPDSVWMLLVRIDAASVSLRDGAGVKTFGFACDRSLSEGQPGDYRSIRDFVASNVR